MYISHVGTDFQSKKLLEPGDPAVDLSLLETERLKKLRVDMTNSLDEYKKNIQVKLPDEYVQQGIIHRLPSWDAVTHKLLSTSVMDVVTKAQKARFLWFDSMCNDLDISW